MFQRYWIVTESPVPVFTAVADWTVGYVSGDTARQVSVSDISWKRIGQFTASKVQLFYRATGILVNCPKRLSVIGASSPAA